MEGFFQIHRQIFESWIFADDKALKIFLWLLGKARHKDGVIPLKVGKGMQYIKLKRGQMIFGRFAAEEALFYNGSLIYRKMQKMQDDETIIVESNNQYSIVTICNYEEYQAPISAERTTNEQGTNKERTRNAQGTNTNKNVNKENNVKKDNKTLNDNESFVFSEFKRITNRNIRVFDKKAKSNLKSRLDEGYLLDDIILAIKNCFKDEYHVENPQFLTLEFILRADKLSKYSTSTQTSQKINFI